MVTESKEKNLQRSVIGGVGFWHQAKEYEAGNVGFSLSNKALI
jgi:hypothetical protein